MMPRLAPFVALHHHLPLARSKSSERRQQGAAHRPSPASLFRPPSRQGRDEAPAQKRTRVGACRDPRQGPRARGERSLRGRRRRVRFAVDDSAVFVWLRRGGRRSQSEEVGRFLEGGALPRRERGELAANRRAHTRMRAHTNTIDGRRARISASRGATSNPRAAATPRQMTSRGRAVFGKVLRGDNKGQVARVTHRRPIPSTASNSSSARWCSRADASTAAGNGAAVERSCA